MALAYQHADPATLRATLGAFFTVGALMSLGALALGGEVDRHRLALGLLVLPGVPIGLLLSRRLVGRLRAETVRPVILAACSVSALVLLVETLV
jgi:uncharacterized membrane protein YfcA